MKDDTILRTAALDALGERNQYDMDRLAIETVPSAQLAQDLTKGCTDTISRAAVVDAIEGVDWYHQNQHGEMVHGANDDEHQAWYKADDIYKAIEALPSAQPGCEDAVSRFEVLRLIDYSSHDLNDAVDNRYMQNEIKQLPSVTPKQPGWIPTSERIPDNDRAVLVTLKWAEDDYEVAVGEYWHNSTASHGWGSFEGHVIAWHELPTPYREGGQS